MPYVRITKDILNKLNIFDEATFPPDLKFWVATRGITSAPWYLQPDDVKYFLARFSYEEYLIRKKQRTHFRHRRPTFFEPLAVMKV
jgi:hypothetical protein